MSKMINGTSRVTSTAMLLVSLLAISCGPGPNTNLPATPTAPPFTITPTPSPPGGIAGCVLFFDNWNTAAVRGGAVNPVFTIRKGTGAVIPNTKPPQYDVGDPSELCAVATYHWNNGAGKAPGTISLVNKTTGVTYGPWQATGMGTPVNVDWQVLLSPRIELKPGDYEVVDSDPPTWSWNATSLDKGKPPKASGFAKVWLAETR